MKRLRRILHILLNLGLVVFLAVCLVNLRVGSYSTGKIFRTADGIAGEDRVAIVFGARVWEGGVPSNTLHDRVLAAVESYKAGKVKVLLLSGDRSGPEYDEPAAMKKLAMDLGVAHDDIFVDPKGYRTYDTCRRAKEIFKIEKAILFTQDYHQPRSQYLCDNLGIDSIGVDTKRRDYVGEWYYWFREFFSRAGAWFEINFWSYPFDQDEPKQRIQP
jgi:vancomycin permeability regulator SanA